MPLLAAALRCSAAASPAPSQPQFPSSAAPLPRLHHRHPHSPRPRAGIRLSRCAHHALDEIPLRDTFAWNTLIRAHLADGDPHQALLVYREMLLRGAPADKHTLPHLLTAARRSPAFSVGRQVHGHALKLGLACDAYVVTALMELYSSFRGPDAAALLLDRSAIRNAVSWTLLAKLYLMKEKPQSALETFYRMVDSDVDFDAVALVTALRACTQLKSLRDGRKVHEIVRQKALELNILVGNSLLKMYVDCGRIEEARTVFDRMRERDALSWTTLIGGYVQNGAFNEGLKLFRLMSMEGVRPDSFSVSAVLPACARMAAYRHGKEVHAIVIRHAIEINTAVQNALMDMYVKAGSIEAASKIFERMAEKDAISWTVMVLGYSLHGQGEVGVRLFHEMEKIGTQPDWLMLNAALHACNTACMVEEGKLVFSRMSEPQIEHCALMVSLLSRAGCSVEARAFIQEHQIERHSEVLRALLNGCRAHQNVTVGKRIAEQLIELEPLNAENYVLLSNFYAASGKWERVEELRETILDMGLKTARAYSWIEVRSKVHVFEVGDVRHPRSQGIYWELENLMKRMEEEEGFRLEGDFSLHDVDAERECTPCGHSEMLAIAFGLISSQGSTTVRVTKNLRVCRNCHAMGKAISKLVQREIILKDPNCFHHFKNGFCSCRDMW